MYDIHVGCAALYSYSLVPRLHNLYNIICIEKIRETSSEPIA